MGTSYHVIPPKGWKGRAVLIALIFAVAYALGYMRGSS